MYKQSSSSRHRCKGFALKADGFGQLLLEFSALAPLAVQRLLPARHTAKPHSRQSINRNENHKHTRRAQTRNLQRGHGDFLTLRQRLDDDDDD